MLLDIDHPSHDTRKVQRIVQGQKSVKGSEGVPLGNVFSFCD